MRLLAPSILAALPLICGLSHALEFVTATVAPGAVPRSDWTGIVGTRFAVQASEIPAGAEVKVTHLGFYAGVTGQFTGSGTVDVEHVVTLHGPQFYPDRQGDYSALPVASAVIPIGNPVDANGWSWIPLPTPATLQGGGYYVIAVDNVSDPLDPFFDPNQGLNIPPLPNYTPVIVAPDVIFKNGDPNTDGFMRGRYGLASGLEAFDASGYLGASFQYTLDAAPVISVGLPATTIVAEGQDAPLTVTLNPAGFPEPTYLWEFDALPIDGTWIPVGTDPFFDVINAASADAGNYRLTITNSLGSVQSTGELVVDPDSDSDGLGDSVETGTGIYVSATDTGTDPNNDDSDGDDLFDGEEVQSVGTNPNIADTDTDGLDDGDEWLTYLTDPFVQDSDGDGLLDGDEVNTRLTDPLSVDSDDDGIRDGYEALTLASDPNDPDSPGGPNPPAVAVSFNNQSGEIVGYGFSASTYAGAPTVRQKNWNRTTPDGFPATGTESNIDSPTFGTLVDSQGNPTAMTLSYSAVGAWADDNEKETAYGRLFTSFIYNDVNNPDVNVSVGNVPYANYDVYVYVGAAANGFLGTVTSGSTTYSYTTTSSAASPSLSPYIQTTDPTGSPLANYCVFRNNTDPTFAFTVSHVVGNAGVFGFQVVESTPPAPGYEAWAASFGLDPETDGAPGFDKEMDGASNLLEYAFATNPIDGTSRPATTPVAVGGNLTVTYQRSKTATDVTFAPEWSLNLVDWFTTGLTDTPTGNETTETVEHAVTISQGADPKKFIRVQATLPVSP